jgi:hypothetical protein
LKLFFVKNQFQKYLKAIFSGKNPKKQGKVLKNSRIPAFKELSPVI